MLDFIPRRTKNARKESQNELFKTNKPPQLNSCSRISFQMLGLSATHSGPHFHQILKGSILSILVKMGRREFVLSQQLMLAWIFIWCFCTMLHAQNHSMPRILKVGALVCLESKTGKSIKVTLELAVQKVNEDPNLLDGTKLALLLYDSNCGALQSAALVQEFDAAIGDFRISTKHTKMVHFTQPFLDSGLVVVVPKVFIKSSHIWQFSRPFTISLWATLGAFFIFTGVVIWILEHRKSKDFQGRQKKQISTTLWFILSTLFFSHKEKVKSILGRAVLIIWLFVILIITSSYTASLTSILTVEQLRPVVDGIAGLITSEVPIGYQSGSIVRDYLLELGVAKDRLVPLNTLQNYATALLNGPLRGGVAAIVDELPVAELFISQRCEFEMSGQEFNIGSWGFAFQNGLKLADDISAAISNLRQNGELQHIHDKWLEISTCEASQQTSSTLGLSSFLVLFVMTGLVSTISSIAYCFRLARWYFDVRTGNESLERLGDLSKYGRIYYFIKTFVSFVRENEIPRDERTTIRSRSREIRKKKHRAKNASRRGSSLGNKGEGSSSGAGSSHRDASTDYREQIEDQNVNPSLHMDEYLP